jgi:hypothetical protein
MRHSTYTLRIMQGHEAADPGEIVDEAVMRGLQDAEDVINDRLPEGFYCKIDGPTGEAVDLAAVQRLERWPAEDDGRDIREHQLRDRLGEDEYEYLRTERKIDADGAA